MKNLKNKKIGVLCGGTSSEREISLKSGKAVYNALKKLGLKAVLVDVNKNVALKLLKEKIDVAYITLHGPMGEDGTIQGMLEIMGIPYTGCGVFSSSASMDKIISKKIFEYSKIPTPQWVVIEKFKSVDEIKYPVVVKPATQGSAIGISIVKNKKEFPKAVKNAFSYDNKVLVEKYIKGTEITAGVLNGNSLPVIEIVPDGKFYDFKSKYTVGKSKHIIPPRLPQKVISNIQEIAIKVYKAFQCKSMCRVDMIVDKNNDIWVLEINTLPGMTETSLFPDAARAQGMSFENLVLEILKSSVR
ncbi:MAG: D-alanine--D-alanine ligase [Endomicrobiia bacterium]|nr:D-alanine--D-alanine ligase [Endomicrobiaceae bacterium]MDD3053607.1 D-alanine--D-alanine ligase [Endomicrobiaceae bacterium]MDD3922768.1 D-alanine--D-alanine ligase [Endomicrobiaceae bacterium]